MIRKISLRGLFVVVTIAAIICYLNAPTQLRITWKGDIRFAEQLTHGEMVRCWDPQKKVSFKGVRFLYCDVDRQSLIVEMPRWKSFQFSDQTEYSVFHLHHLYYPLGASESEALREEVKEKERAGNSLGAETGM